MPSPHAALCRFVHGAFKCARALQQLMQGSLAHTLAACCLAALAAVSSPATAQSLTYRQILDRAARPTSDQKIAYGSDPQQYAELWLPTGTGPHPVVVLIHGGCWLAALPGPELVAFLADDLRRHGVAVWSLTYRRLGHSGGGYPGTFQDVGAGVDKLREAAGQFPLDLTRVVAAGHSAGGHLALWAAARPRLADTSPLKTPQPLPIHAVVGIAAIPDLKQATDGRTGCPAETPAQLADTARRGDPAAWADTSPGALLPLGVKQTLVSGIYDAIVPPAYAWRYQARAQGQGEAVTLASLDQSGHFELIAPWTPPGREVVQRILEATRSAR